MPLGYNDIKSYCLAQSADIYDYTIMFPLGSKGKASVTTLDSSTHLNCKNPLFSWTEGEQTHLVYSQPCFCLSAMSAPGRCCRSGHGSSHTQGHDHTGSSCPAGFPTPLQSHPAPGPWHHSHPGNHRIIELYNSLG